MVEKHQDGPPDNQNHIFLVVYKCMQKKKYFLEKVLKYHLYCETCCLQHIDYINNNHITLFRERVFKVLQKKQDMSDLDGKQYDTEILLMN